MRKGLTLGNSIVPAAITLGVVATMLVLVVQVTLRPWAGTDNGYDTHLNYSAVNADYARTEVSRVGVPGTLDGWKPAEGTDPTDPVTNWVGYGCASCHGLDGTGGLVGPDTGDATFDDLIDHVRDGDEGMPSYTSSVLSDERLATIAEFLGIEKPLAVVSPPAPKPDSTPEPPDSVVATATVATPEPSPATGVEPSPTVGVEASPTVGAEASPTVVPDAPTPAQLDLPVTLTAATAAMVVDGEIDDWAGIEPAAVIFKSISPIPGKKVPDLIPISGELSVATDDQNIYVMLQIDDDYDFTVGDRKRSSKVAVMFLVEPDAQPAMGTAEDNQRKSLGMVDIWHWTLDCGPGELAGGGGVSGGNDPKCNFDDEYALTPKDLEDDGSAKAENSLQGVWNHSGSDGGNGTDGRWTFEISRPLITGDPQDAQMIKGTVVKMALAYWDADQTEKGWTDLGHLQTAWMGWIEVTLP